MKFRTKNCGKICKGHKNCVPLHPQNRGVAQLVAFLVWDQAVAGSSPVTSTKGKQKSFPFLFLFF